MSAILQPVQCQSRQGPGLLQGLVGFSRDENANYSWGVARCWFRDNNGVPAALVSLPFALC